MAASADYYCTTPGAEGLQPAGASGRWMDEREFGHVARGTAELP